jgi:hypothetical protein
MLLISGFRRAISSFRRSPEVGSLMLAYVATVTIYSITEAGYRILTPTWMALLLVIVGSQSIALRGGDSAPKKIKKAAAQTIRHPAKSEFAVASQGTSIKAFRFT